MIKPQVTSSPKIILTLAAIGPVFYGLLWLMYH